VTLPQDVYQLYALGFVHRHHACMHTPHDESELMLCCLSCTADNKLTCALAAVVHESDHGHIYINICNQDIHCRYAQ